MRVAPSFANEPMTVELAYVLGLASGIIFSIPIGLFLYAATPSLMRFGVAVRRGWR